MSDIYIKVNSNNVVTTIHYDPFDPTQGLSTPRDELEKEGFFVSNVPVAEVKTGRRAVMKYNRDSKELYYDYIPIPPSAEERLASIEGALNEIIMNRLGGGL